MNANQEDKTRIKIVVCASSYNIIEFEFRIFIIISFDREERLKHRMIILKDKRVATNQGNAISTTHNILWVCFGGNMLVTLS